MQVGDAGDRQCIRKGVVVLSSGMTHLTGQHQQRQTRRNVSVAFQARETIRRRRSLAHSQDDPLFTRPLHSPAYARAKALFQAIGEGTVIASVPDHLSIEVANATVKYLSTQAMTADSITHGAELIAQSDALIVAAGAGMGVNSGLPDFRGKEGLWKAYRALGGEQVDFYRIACPAAFRTHPARVWGFYGHRLNLYRQTEPHAGF